MRTHSFSVAYVLGVLIVLAVVLMTTPGGATEAKRRSPHSAEVAAMAQGRADPDVAAVASAPRP